MKKVLLVLSLATLVMLSAASIRALEKEELILTIKGLTYDDIQQIEQGVQALAQVSALNSGYIAGSPVGGSGGYYIFRPTGINRNKPAELDSLTTLTGGGGGFIVNLDRNWAVGVNFLGLGGTTSKKIGTDYSYYNVGAFMALPYVMYRPVILPQFILDAVLGVGYMAAGYDIYKSNETTVLADITRSGNTWPVTLEIDARYRIMPTWFAGLKVGYLLANITELKRADFVDSAAQALDFSGLYLAITMGGNF